MDGWGTDQFTLSQVKVGRYWLMILLLAKARIFKGRKRRGGKERKGTE